MNHDINYNRSLSCVVDDRMSDVVDTDYSRHFLEYLSLETTLLHSKRLKNADSCLENRTAV